MKHIDPVEIAKTYDDLISHGIPEDQAQKMLRGFSLQREIQESTKDKEINNPCTKQDLKIAIFELKEIFQPRFESIDKRLDKSENDSAWVRRIGYATILGIIGLGSAFGFGIKLLFDILLKLPG